VLPAVLAIAETTGRSGMDVLRAFIAGHEAAGFVGSLVMRSHYERGFHGTATLGSFGAAAAAGLLLGLDEAQMAIALGLAGTQAAGLKSMFGTMAKPFHAGRAAANGVLAARLAARGFTANTGVLEVAQGFIATQSDADPSADAPLPRPGSLVVGTLFKYHAACYLTHSSIEAIKQLRRQLAFSGPDLASIDLHVAPGHLSVCNIPSPRSGLETKFSLRHTAALAACGKDTAAIQTYSDENASDATLTTVRERVTVHGDRSAGRDAHVVIRTGGGQTAEAKFDVAIPDRDLSRQGERLAAKFHSLADPVIGAERAGMLQRKIAGLDENDDIHVLMAA
jgi:2-methylcitrate dehydratase PrpD